MLKRIHKKILPYLKDREEKGLPMTMEERYDWLKQQFTDWIFIFSTSFLYYEDYDKSDEDARNLFRQSMAAFDGNAPTYHIALLDKPTIVWVFHSLLLGIQMMFSFMMTDEKTPLRLCKHCTKVFVASRPAMSFAAMSARTGITYIKAGRKRKIITGRTTAMSDKDKKELQIRNSTVDFLVFTKDAKEDGIEVRVQNGDVWLTQKAIGQLFDVDRSVVTKHLKNIYSSAELDEDRTCANFAQVADNGKTYRYKFYSLSAIIAVGYRINSGRATQFRQWATKVLDTFTKQGYVLDKSRLINGQIFDEDYFDHLISEIQEIRASERRFYQKITDIYATAIDYAVDSQITKDFFATVQNKMHFAAHGNTAAEVIVARADHTKEHMGLTTWKNAPGGKIVKADVSVAKNYLSKGEMQELNEIVTMYLDYATRQARRHIPMTMADWASKLDAFLQFNDADILHDKGKVTAAIAKAFAESEFEQYRVIQDRLYQSDFDRLVASTETEEEK